MIDLIFLPVTFVVAGFFIKTVNGFVRTKRCEFNIFKDFMPYSFSIFA